VLLAGTIELILLGHFIPTQAISRSEVLAAIFLSPYLETLLFQSLPWMIFHDSRSTLKCVLSMSIPFGFAHIAHGFAVVVSSTMVGAVLASLYIYMARRFGQKSVLVTTFAHTLHNGFTLLLAIAAGAVVL
jgi:membrane protease YdiL (CAAX protease family)